MRYRVGGKLVSDGAEPTREEAARKAQRGVMGRLDDTTPRETNEAPGERLGNSETERRERAGEGLGFFIFFGV